MSEFQFSQQFQDEIVSLALQIAQHQRGEDHLQDVDILAAKYQAEIEELHSTDYAPEELTDVLYYAICINAQGQHNELEECSSDIFPRFSYSQAQIEAAALAKFRLRAAGRDTKDKAAERLAIEVAMALFVRLKDQTNQQISRVLGDETPTPWNQTL